MEVVHDTVRETDPRRLDTYPHLRTNLVTSTQRHGAQPVVVEADGL
ncbi:hypothetical protein ACIBU0_35730 [Streptomyces sp. NPDC049627]